VRRERPARVLVAVPVGSPHTCAQLAPLVDEVICLWAPEPFAAVGQGYRNFAATSDDEVRAALRTGTLPAR
jgi:predicted phosphoribosyltransferase